MFEYTGEIINVVDGDTVDAKIDLGFQIYWHTRLRLNGINTPELHSGSADEHAAAVKAKDRLAELVLGKTAAVKTFKDKTEKYGRYLAELVVDGDNINMRLVSEGLAKRYSGGKR